MSLQAGCRKGVAPAAAGNVLVGIAAVQGHGDQVITGPELLQVELAQQGREQPRERPIPLACKDRSLICIL